MPRGDDEAGSFIRWLIAEISSMNVWRSSCSRFRMSAIGQ
jgi:hypothetical protein